MSMQIKPVESVLGVIELLEYVHGHDPSQFTIISGQIDLRLGSVVYSCLPGVTFVNGHHEQDFAAGFMHTSSDSTVSWRHIYAPLNATSITYESNTMVATSWDINDE